MATTSIGILPTKGKILIDIYDTGEAEIILGDKKFILLGDNEIKSFHQNSADGKHKGIRPRWATVLATSDEAEKDGIKVGDNVLCDTMKWTRKIPHPNGEDKFSMIPVEDILLVEE